MTTGPANQQHTSPWPIAYQLTSLTIQACLVLSSVPPTLRTRDYCARLAHSRASIVPYLVVDRRERLGHLSQIHLHPQPCMISSTTLSHSLRTCSWSLLFFRSIPPLAALSLKHRAYPIALTDRTPPIVSRRDIRSCPSALGERGKRLSLLAVIILPQASKPASQRSSSSSSSAQAAHQPLLPAASLEPPS
jgi:hypothetical protein